MGLGAKFIIFGMATSEGTKNKNALGKIPMLLYIYKSFNIVLASWDENKEFGKYHSHSLLRNKILQKEIYAEFMGQMPPSGRPRLQSMGATRSNCNWSSQRIYNALCLFSLVARFWTAYSEFMHLHLFT